MRFDYIIVGAGYAGSILAERIASQLDNKVLLIDKRQHIAGNAFDYFDEHSVLVHKYGPHIFHTNSKTVWEYLSQFTEWYPYYHHVLAVIEGKKVPIPFNFNTISQLFPSKMAEKLEEKLLTKFEYGKKIPILNLLEAEDSNLKFLADYIYENVFLGYTVKQWGVRPEDLDKSVSSRVPVYLSRDNRYFQDQYQGIPSRGYTKMFEKMINHKNIHVLLNTDYKDIIDDLKFDKIIYTGPIDYFFDKVHGDLPYRSLRFDTKTYDQSEFQEVSQVNYPNNHDYTRITEFKHFLDQKLSKTTVAYEYSQEFVEGLNDPYYPIPNPENAEIFEKYKKEAEKLDNVIFCGRLADYKYYNMDQVAASALTTFKNKIAK